MKDQNVQIKDNHLLFLRFADKDDEIIEDVLGFLHCELALSEKGLVKIFLTEIGNLTLDINNCH